MSYLKKVGGSIRFKTLPLLVMIMLLSGCSLFQTRSADEIAVIRTDDSYADTFKELGIGMVGNYSLKLHRADQSWVNIWVEGYKTGKKQDDPLLELSYGHYPDETYEGRVGLAWIYGADNTDMIKLYTGNSSVGMLEINQFLGDKMESGRTGWEYTMGEEGISLKSGETAIIGSFRMNKGSLRTGYEWTNPDAVEEMIQSNDIVMLLKIKVREEERNR